MSTVEVLIPHYNQAERLARALDSLRRQTFSPAICVVDNASTDHTAEILNARFPDVRLIRLERNVGFGRAINEGVASSDADLVVFVNNDAVADAMFVETLVQMQRRDDVEMVAGCMRSPGGPVETLGVQVDQSLIVYDYLHGADFDSLPERLEPPLAPSGGACLFQRRAFLAAGGYDEAIFAYLEDAELGLRMRLAGMRCAVAPRAFVWHEHSATLGSGSSAKNELLGFGRGYMLWKHGRSLGAGSRARGVALDVVVAAGKAAIDRDLGVIRGRRRVARAVRGEPRPAAVPAFRDRVPLTRIGLTEALERRLGRRRGGR